MKGDTKSKIPLDICVVHTIKISEIGIGSEDSVLGTAALHGHTGLLIFSNFLLEEISLSLERDVFHEVERVGGFV